MFHVSIFSSYAKSGYVLEKPLLVLLCCEKLLSDRKTLLSETYFLQRFRHWKCLFYSLPGDLVDNKVIKRNGNNLAQHVQAIR